MNESEFYGSPVVVSDLGDPATDPPLTVRMQPPDTQARRLDPGVPRVVKVAGASRAVWAYVTGDAYRIATDEFVADWPIQPHVCWSVAMDRLAGRPVPPPASAPAAVLEGDMGVESFKGETS